MQAVVCIDPDVTACELGEYLSFIGNEIVAGSFIKAVTLGQKSELSGDAGWFLVKKG